MKTNILIERDVRGTEINSTSRAFFSRQWEFEHLAAGAPLSVKRNVDLALSAVHLHVGNYLESLHDNPLDFALSNLNLTLLHLFAIKYLALEKKVRAKDHPGLILLVLQDPMIAPEIFDIDYFDAAIQAVNEIAIRYLAYVPSSPFASEFETAYDFAFTLSRSTLKTLASHYLQAESLAWHQGAEQACADIVRQFLDDTLSLEAQRQHDAALKEWDIAEVAR